TLVAEALKQLRVRREAARRYAAENDPHRGQALDAGTLADILERPDAAEWRVERLLPAGGRLLITAQRKTGKTTAVGNIARSLLTGEPLFGRFPVVPIAGSVVL